MFILFIVVARREVRSQLDLPRGVPGVQDEHCPMQDVEFYRVVSPEAVFGICEYPVLLI